MISLRYIITKFIDTEVLFKNMLDKDRFRDIKLIISKGRNNRE